VRAEGHVNEDRKKPTKICRIQAEVIANNVNQNLHGIGQGESRHRKCKWLKLGGGRT
jgi:hypothetical protein